MLSFTTNGNFIDFKYREDQIPFTVYNIISLHNTSKCITWGYGSNASTINFTIDDLTYDEIPITSIYFDGVVMSAQADFKTNIESMFPGLAGGTSSYLVYTALIAQTGTSAPQATELENTLGGTVVWTRSSVGLYKGTLAGAFTLNKTVMPPFGIGGREVMGLNDPAFTDASLYKYDFFPSQANSNEVFIECFDAAYNAVELSTVITTNLLFIEIRVYP